MKNNSLILVFLLLVFASCRKSDANLDVDLSTYNPDTYVADPVIDQWLMDSLTDPYNIQTVYRFERNLTDVGKDVSPIALDKVMPTMQAVLRIFLKPYEKIAGAAFIKKYTPKQYVLYGSPSYNTNGSITLGTADGGRRVVLYELNSLDFSNGEQVRRKIRTIHHEFTHILNQNILIPPEFEQVTKAEYDADWTNSANTDAVAKSLGFVSRYSRSSYKEDFAEMVSHLLVEGQVWFNNYINTTEADAKTKLQAKERLVKDYFKTYFNIEFSELQAEVQKVLKETYNVHDPEDVTQTLPNWLLDNKVSTITYDPAAAHYDTYGRSAAFTTVYNDYKASLQTSNWYLQYIQFRFNSATSMTFRLAFKQGANGSTVYVADYNFDFTVNPITGSVKFTKVVPETANTNSNNKIVTIVAAFEQYILPYLTNRQFVAAWLPATLPSSDPAYRTFGGFYVDGSSSNYFYGPIALK
ncbi:substrate import-associated zinc metallohydrolase lipoprotein [Niabella aurantiaca]|uniref:substrate import-associated zinc metallohydrolase lipoprotein n=1 Tax=Niabella aurantiaca TaxID=379900 RepID=UPI00036162B4|nr:substrate import-associated zinc metallohydrolase lipoprotein [Niabella aurantiaca]